MVYTPKYPTPEHEAAARAVKGFFSRSPIVDAVILYGSCARGRASKDSCVDFVILVSSSIKRDLTELESKWNRSYQNGEVFKRLLTVGKYSHVDVSFSPGKFEPKSRDWTSGPDDFELEIGNTLVYTVPLWVRRDNHGSRLEYLQSKWLPYYSESLRKRRLDAVVRYCRNNLDHIPLYVRRRLYFQAFKRLSLAFEEFLQALFISRKVYPIAYDKWIREQIEHILGLPELYRRLTGLFEVYHLESDELIRKSNELGTLLDEYVIRGQFN